MPTARRRTPLPSPLLLAALLLAPAAGAFETVPPGSSPHDDVTREGARLAGWDGDTRALRAAVREPDFEDSELDPKADDPTRTDGTDSYHVSHHCDRSPGQEDADAFLDTVAYIRAQRDEAMNASEAGEAGKAMEHLGRALHALQDCFSHSNGVDLPPEAQGRLVQAVSNASADPAPPPGLRLTSYEPGIDDPERPPGDGYTHGEFAKDAPDKNGESKARLADGRTKYEAAHDLAANATAAFLRGVRDGLPASAWTELQEVEPDRVPEAWPIPGPAAGAGALSALAAAAWLRARR